MPDAPAPERIGRYRIDRKIGEGGMGIVYAAHDERLDRRVALKMIRGDGDETSRKRLWREARAAAGVSHPRICQLFEVEESDDGLFMSMELLEGEPLTARLDRGAIPPADAATIALETLEALEALHARGFVHRDLKPSNIFLTAHGVKLLDFGLARPAADATSTDTATKLTQAGAVAGTPHYMAPEQVRGLPLDGRADLFALAAVLYEMLSGEVAFAGETGVDVLHAVLHEQPAPLMGSASAVAMDRVVRRGLAKRADDRYPTASAMAEELRTASQIRDSSAVTQAQIRPITRFIALPFRVLRPDPETDFLAFSLPDAITASLVGLKALLVRSSAAAARFDPQVPDLKRLAAEADVDLALTGTVLRSGDQLRATAQLVEAPGGAVVWSHTAQLPLNNVFALQDTLVERIVQSLSVPLSARDSEQLRRDVPASPAAYELYLRGNELARHYDLLPQARDLYRRCLELDPRFAPAWARLGRCHRLAAKYLQEAGEVERAEEAFRRALEINPDLPLAHNLYAQLECDAGRAIDAMRRLLPRAHASTDPELFAGLVHACRYCGLLDASVAAHHEARRLDAHVITSVPNTYSLMCDWEGMLRVVTESFSDIFPRAMALYRLGRSEEAVEVFAGLPEPAGSAAQMMNRFRVAFADLLAGRHDEARRVMVELAHEDKFDDPEGRFNQARILTHLGEIELALSRLRASVAGMFSPGTIAEDPWFDPLRRQPEFKDILRRAQERHADALAVFRAHAGERLLGLRVAA